MLAAIIRKLKELTRMLGTRPYYGFVTGHGYLTEAQVTEVRRVLESPAQATETVAEYERRFAALVGDGRGLATAGGRMALFATLRALGVGAGHEVILPAFTCSVVASAVLRTGATPVFTNVDPATFGTDPDAAAKAITPRTRAIIAQHSFGIPCRVGELRTLADGCGAALIEDCALTVGSTRDGVAVGNTGDAAFFSTDHSKPMNTVVGGFFYTRDAGLYDAVAAQLNDAPTLPEAQQRRLFGQFLLERRLARPASYGLYQLAMLGKAVLRRLSDPGMTFLDDDYVVERTGAYAYPARLPAVLARIGLFELDRWPAEAARREALLQRYLTAAYGTPLAAHLPVAYADPALRIVAHRLAFTHPRADALKTLMDQRVHTAWTWFMDPIVGARAGLASLGYAAGACPVSEKVGAQVLNWPCVVEEGAEGPLLEFFAQVARQA